MSKSNLATVESLYTDENYLEFERQASEKHELIDGEIVAMAGATREHNLIGTNTTIALGTQLRGKSCELYANDMRVRMKKGRYSYPDVVVVCGEPQFADDEYDVLLNPVVVVEVLSKSTRFRDKTEKLATFQKMDSIKEVLLIEQDILRIEHYIKQTPMQWLLRIYEDLNDLITLESIDCKVSLTDIYSQIEFKEMVDEFS
jgi:Uma2 family endonuclease